MKQGLNQTNVFVINAQAGETVPLSVTATTANVAFALPASGLNYDVVVTNVGTKTAFVGFAATSALAVAVVPGTSGTKNATPIPAGAIITLQKNSDAEKNNLYCCAICGGSDTTTLYFTSVQGS